MNTRSQEETRRLAWLREYKILGTPPEPGFERIARMAARLFSTPMAAVSFVDARRRWYKASYGLPRQGCPREQSFCARTIESDAVMIVPDASNDPRFADYALVVRKFGVRFYAGAPLLTADGCRLGALCVLDRIPRQFQPEDAAMLVDLAAMVVDELDLRRLAGRLHDQVAGGQRTQTALRRQQEALQRQRGTLESRVERRTVELVRANKALRAEIARREKGESALQRAKEEAEKANRAKSEFLSRMSHELRTPLNAILGFGQILQAQVPDQGHRDCTTHILNAGRHLLGLINEVLDISRIEAGRVELSLEPVRMAEAVGETLDLIRPLAAEHGIRVELAPRACVGEIARADRQRLKQVLLNLLSNAVKYSPEGSRVTLDCCTVKPRQVRLCVRDAGPGMTAESLARLFVPFDRLGADQAGIPGTGLGLALSKHLIEAMHGKLGVRSAPGKGSTFWVQLPRDESNDFRPLLPRLRAPGSRNAQGRYEAAPAKTPPHANGYVYSNGNGHRYALSDRRDAAPEAASAADGMRTVLYIEDDPSNLSLVEHLLEDHPRTRLLTASRGMEGLEIAFTRVPDLILLDLHLPDVAGWEVLARLRNDPVTQHIPVVAVSADATRDAIDRLLHGGAHAYLTKPLNVDHFLHLLNTLRCPPLSALATAAAA